MPDNAELERKILILELKLAILNSNMLDTKVADLQKKVAELESKITELQHSKVDKSDLSFKTAAYNPTGVTSARGPKIEK